MKKNPISELNEFCQRQRYGIDYEFEEIGGTSIPSFIAKCILTNKKDGFAKEFSSSPFESKREAKENVAKQVLSFVNQSITSHGSRVASLNDLLSPEHFKSFTNSNAFKILGFCENDIVTEEFLNRRFAEKMMDLSESYRQVLSTIHN